MATAAVPPPTAPKPIITNDDYSSLPKVIGWCLVVAEAFAVLAKLFTLGWMRRFRWLSADNILIVTSLIAGTGLVVCISLACTYGLGQRLANISPSNLEHFQKAVYVADLLYVITLSLSKVAVLVLIWTLTPDVYHHRFMMGSAALIAAWTFSSLFAAAFQCPVPDTWDILSERCISRFSFWTYFGVLNIITEFNLILVPCLIIFDLQSSVRKKLSVMSGFMLRIFVIGAIIAELYFRAQVRSSTDPTFDAWPVSICVLFVQAASIIFACVPFMRPFFSSLESGFVRTDDVRRMGSRQKTLRPLRDLIFSRNPYAARTNNANVSDGAVSPRAVSPQTQSIQSTPANAILSRPTSNTASTAEGGRSSQQSSTPMVLQGNRPRLGPSTR